MWVWDVWSSPVLPGVPVGGGAGGGAGGAGSILAAETCLAAAVGGHLEVLLWARENGCAWDFVECLEAAVGGDPAVFKWIVDSDPVAAGRVLGILCR